MRFLLVTLTLATILFTSCDETKKVIDVAGNVQLSGSYNITNVGDIKVNDPDISINFTALDKSVRGRTGCNSFFGNYTIDLYSMSFDDLAVSEKYCDEPIMTKENALLNALRETGSYSYEDNVLTLYSKNDRSVLLTAKKEKKDS